MAARLKARVAIRLRRRAFPAGRRGADTGLRYGVDAYDTTRSFHGEGLGYMAARGFQGRGGIHRAELMRAGREALATTVASTS
jgi:hypothetical protein